MERITRRDLDQALANHIDACERYGISYDGRLVVTHGSRTYGRAYRLYRMPTDSYAQHNPPIGDDYLGRTAREAYETLTTRTRAMHDMAYALELPRHETTQDRANDAREARGAAS